MGGRRITIRISKDDEGILARLCERFPTSSLSSLVRSALALLEAHGPQKTTARGHRGRQRPVGSDAAGHEPAGGPDGHGRRGRQDRGAGEGDHDCGGPGPGLPGQSGENPPERTPS